ncbi:MAG: hypothetical protein ACKPKO_52280, partial [Candidatus Fonsibacter sp.]
LLYKHYILINVSYRQFVFSIVLAALAPTLFLARRSTLLRAFSNNASTSYFVCGQTVHGSLNKAKSGRGIVYQFV